MCTHHQGYRQDHAGRIYTETREDGMQYVTVAPMTERLAAQLEPVDVVSKTRPGVVYRSMQFLRSRNGG